MTFSILKFGQINTYVVRNYEVRINTKILDKCNFITKQLFWKLAKVKNIRCINKNT